MTNPGQKVNKRMRKRKIRSDTVEGSSLPINLNNQIIIIIIMITRLYPPGPHNLCFSVCCRQSSTSLSLSSRKCKWPIPLCHGWWVVFCCCCCCCPDNSHLAHNKAARYHNHRTHAYCRYLYILWAQPSDPGTSDTTMAMTTIMLWLWKLSSGKGRQMIISVLSWVEINFNHHYVY